MYVDLGDIHAQGSAAVRATTDETAITRANEMLHPYTLDVKGVPSYSVYEVGHRLTDKFDDVETDGARTPRVFITGDACHTHSVKAGQGMNVSMQDGFNLGWKRAHGLTGRSPEALLHTYPAERQVVAEELIKFDRLWSSMMGKQPGESTTGSDQRRRSSRHRKRQPGRGLSGRVCENRHPRKASTRTQPTTRRDHTGQITGLHPGL